MRNIIDFNFPHFSYIRRKVMHVQCTLTTGILNKQKIGEFSFQKLRIFRQYIQLIREFHEKIKYSTTTWLADSNKKFIIFERKKKLRKMFQQNFHIQKIATWTFLYIEIFDYFLYIEILLPELKKNISIHRNVHAIFY